MDCQTSRLPLHRCTWWGTNIAECRPLLGALPLFLNPPPSSDPRGPSAPPPRRRKPAASCGRAGVSDAPARGAAPPGRRCARCQVANGLSLATFPIRIPRTGSVAACGCGLVDKLEDDCDKRKTIYKTTRLTIYCDLHTRCSRLTDVAQHVIAKVGEEKSMKQQERPRTDRQQSGPQSETSR